MIYQLHVGTFSEEGTFDGVRRRLGYLADLGVTAIQLMPIADFSGTRNWGYDGVLPFAPDRAYGSPEALKLLIDEAHGHGLQVFLDVVYNHFGPDGNYLHSYAPDMFRHDVPTPWGDAIDYRKRVVRDFVVNNVLLWLEEYRVDGLRFDAVQAIVDDTEPHLLEEIAHSVRHRFGRHRYVHLVLENEENQASLLEREDGTPTLYNAQWNDDFHHAAHVALTGEDEAYYKDYADAPVERLGKALAEGFVYQGENMPYRGSERGEPSAHLPPTAFVNFLQNHDQIGNRAFGDRLSDLAPAGAVEAMTCLLLLSPSIPMLFMGEEWGTKRPFRFFTDFHDELADAVREGAAARVRQVRGLRRCAVARGDPRPERRGHVHRLQARLGRGRGRSVRRALRPRPHPLGPARQGDRAAADGCRGFGRDLRGRGGTRPAGRLAPGRQGPPHRRRQPRR